MTKKNLDPKKHALHNEKACDYLHLNTEFADWVITTAFYSALHFVSAKIFPFSVPNSKGEKRKIETLEQYIDHKSPTQISKHNHLTDLVAEKCNVIHAKYKWLLDTCKTARYYEYQVDPHIAQKAMSYMKEIKKHCVN